MCRVSQVNRMHRRSASDDRPQDTAAATSASSNLLHFYFFITSGVHRWCLGLAVHMTSDRIVAIDNEMSSSTRRVE